MTISKSGLLFLFFILGITVKAQNLDIQKVMEALKNHNKAVLVKDDIWIRDPFIALAPDGYYYLTGTTQMPETEFNAETKYNTGLGKNSLVGWKMRVWKSKDLAKWEYLGEPFDLTMGYWAKKDPQAFKTVARDQWHLWAPEIHFINGKWCIVHTTPAPVRGGSNFAVTMGDELQGPYQFPLGDLSKGRHDPSLFQDTDGKVYLTWGNTQIALLSKDYKSFVGIPKAINPTTMRTMPNGKKEAGIGHEGVVLEKIGNKYVQFGTGWSTNGMRKGSYNLYYVTSDNVSGPYDNRKFVGRFLGHGTPFQDKQGRWWCTAFYNADVPPLSKEGIRTRDLSETAQTINKQGLTLVPLDVKVLPNGDVHVRAIDPDYATPGPDEVQKF